MDVFDISGSAVYVSGPMTGILRYNKPAFDAMAAKCWDLGARFVVNPADLIPMVEADEITREQCMKSDINKLLLCDAIVMLPGWEQSPGALLERDIAIAVGMKVVDSKEIGT